MLQRISKFGAFLIWL